VAASEKSSASPSASADRAGRATCLAKTPNERYATAGELAEAQTAWLGRKSDLKVGLRNVRDRETGMALNAVRERLEEAFAGREAELERSALAQLDEQLDVTLPGTPLRRGRLHPLTQIRREVEDIFLGLGYEIVDSREVETVWHNFDALNQPLTHPSRSHRDTFYVDDDTLLRTHTSTGQIRVMEERKPPIYIATLGRVYRRDTPSPRSTPNFHQVEALAVDRNIGLADLKGTLLHFFHAMFGDDRDVRMRTGFFPFTEPSVEFDVTCFLCGERLCLLQVHGWFEMGGRASSTRRCSRTSASTRTSGRVRLGLGLDRIAAQRHGIPDIRMFWENDLRVLRQF
jgi:phenylalanyl-tRNA synthetase alpha chain